MRTDGLRLSNFFNLVPTLTAEETSSCQMRLASKDGAAGRLGRRNSFDLVGSPSVRVIGRRAKRRRAAEDRHRSRLGERSTLAPCGRAHRRARHEDRQENPESVPAAEQRSQEDHRRCHHDARFAGIASRVLDIRGWKIVEAARLGPDATVAQRQSSRIRSVVMAVYASFRPDSFRNPPHLRGGLRPSPFPSSFLFLQASGREPHIAGPVGLAHVPHEWASLSRRGPSTTTFCSEGVSAELATEGHVPARRAG